MVVSSTVVGHVLILLWEYDTWERVGFFKEAHVKQAVPAFCSCAHQRLVKLGKRIGGGPVVAILPLTAPGCGPEKPDTGLLQDQGRKALWETGFADWSYGYKLQRSSPKLPAGARTKGTC